MMQYNPKDQTSMKTIAIIMGIYLVGVIALFIYELGRALSMPDEYEQI
jgi:hypothetical protein